MLANELVVRSLSGSDSQEVLRRQTLGLPWTLQQEGSAQAEAVARQSRGFRV